MLFRGSSGSFSNAHCRLLCKIYSIHHSTDTYWYIIHSFKVIRFSLILSQHPQLFLAAPNSFIFFASFSVATRWDFGIVSEWSGGGKIHSSFLKMWASSSRETCKAMMSFRSVSLCRECIHLAEYPSLLIRWAFIWCKNSLIDGNLGQGSRIWRAAGFVFRFNQERLRGQGRSDSNRFIEYQKCQTEKDPATSRRFHKSQTWILCLKRELYLQRANWNMKIVVVGERNSPKIR